MCRVRFFFARPRGDGHNSGGARIGRRVVEGVAIDAASMLLDRLLNGNARRKSHSRLLVSSWATNRAERTVVDVKGFLDECPSFSPTAWIHATRPVAEHGEETCACFSPGAESGVAPQREREGHPTIAPNGEDERSISRSIPHPLQGVPERSEHHPSRAARTPPPTEPGSLEPHGR